MTFFSKYKNLVFILIGIWLCLTSVAALGENSFTERRISVGQKLFRSLLVAKLNYQNDMHSPNGFYVNLLYNDDAIKAKDLSEKLAKDLTVLHNHPVTIRPISLQHYLQENAPIAIGSFITENLADEQLEQVIEHSITNQHILFSPFEGDVEQGVMAGLSVESKVRPFVNMQALAQSQIELKSFFIKVSKQYAP